MRKLLLTIFALLAVNSAHAHIASNGFLSIQVGGASATGALALAIRDGELSVGLDSNGDGKVTWGELRSHEHDLQAYLRDRLALSVANGQCPLSFQPLQVNERVDGNYVLLPFVATCPQTIAQLRIDYRVLDDVDPSHRGLLTLASADGIVQTAVLGGQTASQSFNIVEVTRWRAFAQYLQAGVWHIWSGIDHLLFLLSLLLPAVLIRQKNQWQPVSLATPAFINVAKVVTAFTLAHSITLSLAVFDIIRLPGRLTESVIAASIVVAALNNVFPRITQGRWRLAFAFGLLHGFGFASVLTDMGLPQGARLLTLVAFNLGVEVGQLAVVVAVMPIAYAIRSTTLYRRGVMPWGSSAIAALALVWLVQRATT